MTFSRKMPVSIRFDLTLLDIIDKLTETDFDGNRTNCVSKLVQDGLKLKKFQQTIQDNPEKSNEIITEMNEKIENESVYDWLNNLTDRQKKGIVEYIQTTTD